MSSKHRLGQTLCKVSWKQGTPYLQFAKVTKANTRNCYMDKEPKKASLWFATAEEAIESQYRTLFMYWDSSFGEHLRERGWTMEDSIRCICEVRRLERRLLKRHRKSTKSQS